MLHKLGFSLSFFFVCVFISAAHATAERLTPVQIKASSVLPPSKSGNYRPENILSSDNATAWVKGASGDGVGESLDFYFADSKSFESLHICNGYQKSKAIYYNNARLKSFSLVFSDGEKKLFTIQDKMSCFEYDLHGVGGSSVKLTVESVYPGLKWQDLAVSYIQFFGAKRLGDNSDKALNTIGSEPAPQHESSKEVRSTASQNVQATENIHKQQEVALQSEQVSRSAQAPAAVNKIEPSNTPKEESFLDKVFFALIVLVAVCLVALGKKSGKKCSSKEGTLKNNGIIRPRTGNATPWEWNGKILKPRFSGKGEPWKWDGKTLSPYISGSGVKWDFDGKVFRPRSGNANPWDWDGQTLRPRRGNAPTWTWDGNSFRPRTGSATAWNVEGEVPEDLVAGALAAGILKNE